jgi:16S rRNA (cytosine1402-N4)-methyltransferase
VTTDLHLPVLEKEVIAAFMEQTRRPMHFFEGTFGRGGHTNSLLKNFPKSKTITFDRDAQAVEYGKEKFSQEISSGRLVIIHDDFRNLKNHKLGHFDGALLDLGVSSPQLDLAERGFSFMHDGPLDMRMDQNQELTAAQILNEYSEKELSDLFYHWGEIRKPNRVVRAIVHDRKETPYTTTRQLASMIERVDGRGRNKRKGHHPATNYFMALRIAVNGELEGLVEFCEDMHLHLEPGSRFIVISFHSLEDRIIKQTFRKMNKRYGRIINKKVIIAGDEELERNPRARSAKMRIFEMGGHV